jgi:hypothetical protein
MLLHKNEKFTMEKLKIISFVVKFDSLKTFTVNF